MFPVKHNYDCGETNNAPYCWIKIRPQWVPFLDCDAFIWVSELLPNLKPYSESVWIYTCCDKAYASDRKRLPANTSYFNAFTNGFDSKNKNPNRETSMNI